MIYNPLSALVRSTEHPLAAGAVITANGQALVAVNTGGIFGVKPSTGSNGEKFVGFVNAQTSMAPFQQGTATKNETLVLNASGAATLAFAPISGTLGVYNVTGAAAVASNAIAVGSDGVTVTVTGGAGATVNVTYSHALTVVQARTLFGDVQPGGYSGLTIGQIGVAKQGVIYTDQFDTSVNWHGATGVKLAANGKVTDQTGSGTAIAATIVAIPRDDYPYLGLDFVTPSL